MLVMVNDMKTRIIKHRGGNKEIVLKYERNKDMWNDEVNGTCFGVRPSFFRIFRFRRRKVQIKKAGKMYKRNPT